MKVPATALAALLLVAIWSPAEAHLDVSNVAASSQEPGINPTVCCFAYSKLQIPRSFVASAYTTSSSCALPAVVLVTQKGHQLCVDPQALWVQAYLKHLQMLKD